MTRELEFAGYRFYVLANQVLEPAVYPAAAALDVAAFQCRQRISYADRPGR